MSFRSWLARIFPSSQPARPARLRRGSRAARGPAATAWVQTLEPRVLLAATTLVSHTPGGASGNLWSTTAAVSVSADGRFVAFESRASDLVTGDTNGMQDIFVYDRTTDTVERVSLSSAGAQGNFRFPPRCWAEESPWKGPTRCWSVRVLTISPP